MSYIEAIILGLVQGLSEFLPISSSGHLALLQQWFGIEEDKVLLFAVLLHFGTLLSVCIIYWKDIVDLAKEFVLTIIDLCKGRPLGLHKRPTRKLGLMIIVGTIPTACIGFFFSDLFDALYTSILPIGIGLIMTGFLLIFAEKKNNSNKDVHEMTLFNALFIGTIQGIAIYPGISRSGSTLFASLVCDFDRKFAVKFIFLLSIPAILGSVILEAPKAFACGFELTQFGGPLVVGMVVAMVSGLFAIKTMIQIVSNKKLSYFSYYVWILGVIVIFYGAGC